MALASVVMLLSDVAVVGGKIALTFDDGPDPQHTPAILDVLDRYGVAATFFFIGWRAEEYADVARKVVEAGHEIGNHSYSHPRLTDLSAEEIRREIARAQEAIEAATGVRPRLFRPPHGRYNNVVMKAANEAGLRMVLWTQLVNDWQDPGEAAIVRRAVAGARNGAIVLLHCAPQTANALPTIIEKLRARGYGLVRVSEVAGGRGRVGGVYGG